MPYEGSAGLAIAGDQVEHSRRKTDGLGDLGEQQRGQRRELGWLEHHRIPHGQRWGDLPGQHQQRKVPGNDLPDHAHGRVIGQLVGHDLRPACVIGEVACDKRHVQVARLAYRLAVVQRLENREQPTVLLDLTRERVQVAGAHMPRCLTPRGESLARGADRGVHVFRTTLARVREGGAVGRVEHRERLRRGPPLTADEVAELPPVLVQPGQRRLGRLRRRPPGHGLEDLGDAGHAAQAKGNARPSCASSHCLRCMPPP